MLLQLRRLHVELRSYTIANKRKGTFDERFVAVNIVRGNSIKFMLNSLNATVLTQSEIRPSGLNQIVKYDNKLSKRKVKFN